MNTASQTLRNELAPAMVRRPAAAGMLLNMLERVEGGRVTLTLPDGERVSLGHGGHGFEVHLREWSVFEQVLATGDIGFAETYINGLWDTPELARLLTLLAQNRGVIEAALYGRWWSLLRHRLLHLLRSNTRAGSRRNIAAHYDLGNDFYRLWLDPGMTYSAALFDDEGALGLEDAQAAKYRRILDRLGVKPGQQILEIGCGWGAFAELAAREYGARVRGVTLSARQLEFARRRVAQAGAAELATFELRDYRDVQGRFDHIVSIEMFEAVGERFWPLFFRRLHQLLNPGGKALIQTITIDEALFERYRHGTDFIQRYIFPGGMLPSAQRFVETARAAGLRIGDDFAFGADYARTLALWHRRFVERTDELRDLGYDEVFQRTWRFYLAYCEAGFRAGSTDVRQFELVRGDA